MSFSHTAEPANPTALVLVSGDGQSGARGAVLPNPLVVRLEDDNGNGVGGKSITWVVAPGSGSVDPDQRRDRSERPGQHHVDARLLDRARRT